MRGMKDKTVLVCAVLIIYTCASGNSARGLTYILTNRKNMTDDGKCCVEYNCVAELDEYNCLSWYQLKGSKHILLNMTQHQTSEKLNKTIVLHHTLGDDDNSTEIYCAKERHGINFTMKEVVQWYHLSFYRIFPPLDHKYSNNNHNTITAWSLHIDYTESDYIKIEPNPKLIYFDIDTTITLVCHGSMPTDGRTLTWYFENYADFSGKQSEELFIKPGYEVAVSQNYDYQNNENVLELQMKEVHHLKRLFCAQDMNTEVIDAKGEKSILRYRQRARSETILLIYHGLKGHEGGGRGTPLHKHGAPLWSTILVAVLALILFINLIVAIMKLKKKEKEFEEKERLWCRPPLQTPTEHQYETVYSHGAGLLRRPKNCNNVRQT